MDANSTVGKLVSTLISLVIFIIFAIIYFIVILFIMKVAGDLVFGSGSTTGATALIAAAVLTAGTLIGGGSLSFFGKEA